jgi:hypothetical protein
VAAQAAPGEVLVSGTVRDLIAGSGIELSDRGVHTLKGIAGAWQLLAVAGCSPRRESPGPGHSASPGIGAGNGPPGPGTPRPIPDIVNARQMSTTTARIVIKAGCAFDRAMGVGC